MVFQKDWVIVDLSQGDLFRVSIVKYTGARGRGRRKRNSKWYLTRYLNYFGLDAPAIEALLVQEYVSMLDACKSKDVQEHSYTISHHRFQKQDMNPNYWKGMLGKKGKNLFNVDIQGIRAPINRKRFEEELYRLLEGSP